MEENKYINYVFNTLIVLIIVSFTIYLTNKNLIPNKLASVSGWIGLGLFILFIMFSLWKNFYRKSSTNPV
jgi:hypothetical protein